MPDPITTIATVDKYLDDGGFIVAIEGEAADVGGVGEEEGGVSFVGLAPGAVVTVSSVSVVALALERPLLVGAQLRASAQYGTLVDIFKQLPTITNNFHQLKLLKLINHFFLFGFIISYGKLVVVVVDVLTAE